MSRVHSISASPFRRIEILARKDLASPLNLHLHIDEHSKIYKHSQYIVKLLVATFVNMDAAAKQPVKLVKVIRVLGRTGMRTRL